MKSMKRMKRADRIRLALLLLFIVLLARVVNAPKDVIPVATGVTVPTITATADSSSPTATLALSLTSVPTVLIMSTPSATLVPMATKKPLATNVPGLEITPISGQLYEITGSVNALGCPDTRCKVVDVYKKRSIIVVTGTVTGTTYKSKETRLWYEVIFHDGRKVYVHGAFVKPHVNT